MASIRDQLIPLIEEGHIPKEKIDEALSITKVFPSEKDWLVFIGQLLLWLGGIAIAFAVMFFIAYNLDNIGKFVKFGAIEALIIISVFAYWKFYSHPIASKVSLLSASILLGVLLALYGITYQTGADTWQLFFTWAMLITPWVIIGRFPALWIVWLTLLNTTIILYESTFNSLLFSSYNSTMDTLAFLFIFNTLALLIWEFLSNKFVWLNERWAVRLLAFGSGISITWLIMDAIFETKNILSALIWLAWIVSFYFFYRYTKHDLFMLSGIALSSIVVAASFLLKVLFETDMNIGSLFVSTILIVGMSAGAAFWLKKIQKEWQS